MREDRFNHILQFLDFDMLNDWEQDFVISVESQFKRKGELSELQENKLEDIFRKQNAA